MSVSTHGTKWWFDFWFDGQRYRQNTGLEFNPAKPAYNRAKAEAEENDERSRLRGERDEREKGSKRLQCEPEKLLRCPECEKLFNREVGSGHMDKIFCGENCRDAWRKKQSPVPTLREFIDSHFEPWARNTFERTKPATWRRWYKTNLRTLKNFPALADARLDRISSETISAFKSFRLGEGCTVATVNRSLQVLRRALNYAVEKGKITSAVKMKLDVGSENHRERVITPLEEARYLAAAPEPLASFATVLIDSGMRPEENLRLCWQSVAWVNGRQGSMGITHGKTKAARRTLPMSPRVRAILEARWKKQGEPEEGWVWPADTKSGHAEPSTFKKLHARTFKTIQEQTQQGQKPVRPFVLYTLRHTFLTRLGLSGIDQWTLMRTAGHSSILMTQKYVHANDEGVLSAMANFEAKSVPQISRQ